MTTPLLDFINNNPLAWLYVMVVVFTGFLGFASFLVEGLDIDEHYQRNHIFEFENK